MQPDELAPTDAGQLSPPTLWELFTVFTRIGLTSFGGGLSGWMLRELVQRRRWLDEESFLSGLALSQAFPGVNVVNLAIWLGYRFNGTAGAVAGAFGIIAPPAALVVFLAIGFGELSRYPLAHVVLTGIGAAAIGLSLNMGVIAAQRALRGVVPGCIMAVAFVAVGFLHISLPLVVVVLGAISVTLAYRALPPAGR